VGREEYLPLYNQLYREYFAVYPPARTAIINCLGDAIKYEIECIAIKPAVQPVVPSI